MHNCVETLKHAQDKRRWWSPIIRTGKASSWTRIRQLLTGRQTRGRVVLTMGLHGWHARNYQRYSSGYALPQHPISFSSSFAQQTISFHPSSLASSARPFLNTQLRNILADAIAAFDQICSEGVEGVRIVEVRTPC